MRRYSLNGLYSIYLPDFDQEMKETALWYILPPLWPSYQKDTLTINASIGVRLSSYSSYVNYDINTLLDRLY